MENPTHGDSACPAHADFDPLSPTFLADPFAFLSSLQRGAPVFYAPTIGYYVVTRYADIEAVFLDHETYSAAPAQLPLVPLAPEAAQILSAAGTAPRPSMVSSGPAGPYAAPLTNGARVHAAASCPDVAPDSINSGRVVERD